MTNKYYTLYFRTDEGANVSVRVPDADADVSPTAVKEAMTQIITGGMAGSSKGIFTEARRATYTEQETIEYDITA